MPSKVQAIPAASTRSSSLRWASAKISRKGQLTLPAAMRRKLGTDVVTLRMEGETITLEPQKSLAGALKAYARGVADIKRETEEAWTKHIEEKYGRRR